MNNCPSTDATHTAESNEKYPIMTRTPTRKNGVNVFQDDFLFVQVTELQNHLEVYRIHDLYNALRVPLNESNEEIKPPSFDLFNLEMLNELSKHICKHRPQADKQLPKNDPAQFVFKSIVIEQDLIMNYREQIKLLYHLQRFIDKASVKYPGELTDFQTYLSNTLESKVVQQKEK